MQRQMKNGSEAGSAMLEALGPLFLINLPQRHDRRHEFAGQLDRVGLRLQDIKLFPAIRPENAAGFPSIGSRGCFLSHLAVLKEAQRQAAPVIIICEDDLDFAEDFDARMPVVIAALAGKDWDIFYAGHHGLDGPDGPVHRIAPYIPIRTTHFIAFRQRAISRLVPYLEAMLTRPAGDAAGGPMHVDGAYSWFRRNNRDLVTMAAIPPLGHQRPSRTDIDDLPWFDRLPLIRSATSTARRLRHLLSGEHGKV